jgi:hypothetical protein
MNAKSIGNWVQLGATLFVAAGIVLVVIEMRQAKQIAAAEATSVAMQGPIDVSVAVGGERFAESLATACFYPEKLTPTDSMVLDAYYNMVWYQALRVRMVEDTGDFDLPVKNISLGFYMDIAGMQHGRWWLNRKIGRGFLSEQEKLLVERAIELTSEIDCTAYHTDLAGLKSNSDVNPSD